MSISNSGEYDLLDQLAEEFAERFRRGERPSIQEYTARYPVLASEIRELFPAMVKVERVKEYRKEEIAEDLRPAHPALSQVGDYRILREVGRGGMGIVYEAEQVSLARRVALKVLPSQVAGDPNALRRFRREAKAAAGLHHTNIVPVFEVGREGDVAFYAMQFIQGQGLDRVIDELRRLSEPLREAHEPGPAEFGGPAKPASSTRNRLAEPVDRRNREIGQMAELVLSGRLVAEAPGSPPSNPAHATGPSESERFGMDGPAGRGSPASREDHAEARTRPDLLNSAVLPGGALVSEIDISGSRLPFFRSVAQIGRQVAQGLAYAHARGIIHRDIKPANLLLDTAGVVWITDFGLAKTEDGCLTNTGDILGTLRYLAPERFRGEGDTRADTYALGLTLYELLTLRPAYDSSDRLKLIERIKDEEPIRPRSLDDRIPRDLETIVLKATARDPERRYSSADAMAEDLRRFLADEPILARRTSAVERYQRWVRHHPSVVVLGGVLAVVLALATVGSLLVASRFASLAESESRSASSERSSRLDADQARKAAEKAGAEAQAETYRAMLSEVLALRSGRQLGWREEALNNLARLARMNTPRRDLVELRSEAVASLGEFGVKEVARFKTMGYARLDFSPDSRTLMTASRAGQLDLWDVPGRRHSRRLLNVSQYLASSPDDPDLRQVRFLPDGDLAVLNISQRVAFFETTGGPSTRPPIERESAKAVKLAVDRQGRWLAVGWNDGRVDLYNAVTGDLERSFEWRSPWDFAMSPDGRWLALQGFDGPIEVVPTSGQGRPMTLSQDRGYFRALAISPDGSTLASVAGQAVMLWDLATQEERLALRGHRESVTALAFSPDGTMVASACGDSTTRIWDARDGEPLAVIPGTGFLRALAFSPDGRYLADSSEAGTVSLYELKGRREQRRLVGHQFGALRLAFHPHSPRLATSSNDHTVILWNAESAHPLVRWDADELWITGLAFSPDGSLIASTCGNGSTECPIRLWDAESGTLRRQLPGNTRGVWALAFDPTGRRIASGDSAGTILLFDIESGQILRREALGASMIRSIAFYKGGRHLLVGLENGSIALIDLERPGPPRQIVLSGGCGKLAVDDLTNRAITGDSEGTIIALTLPDLSVIQRLAHGHHGPIESIAFSPDGRLMVTGGSDREVVVRDPSTFEKLFSFPAWTGRVEDLAFDTTGRWLAYLGANTDVNLWDMEMVHDELAAIGLALRPMSTRPQTSPRRGDGPTPRFP